MKYTVFSIDDQSRSGIDQFKRQFEASITVGNLVDLVGCYKGDQDYAFVCDTRDFTAIADFYGYVRNQECVMCVSSCNKQYATMVYRGGREEFLGSLRSGILHEIVTKADSGSYNPATEQAFYVVKGNPDKHIGENCEY